MITTYKDLKVWQRSMGLVIVIYKLTEEFPQEEQYGLTSQMRRSAVSIPSNIAEGRFRGTRNDFVRFLHIAYGSGAELGTQIEVARRLPNTETLDYSQADGLLEETMKMLNVMIKKLTANKAKS